MFEGLFGRQRSLEADADASEKNPAPRRPVIGLALGGGAARCFAHIGILRVLIEQSFQRVNGTTKVKVDVRIISSTARDLEHEIQDGGFREDLFHRLSVVPLTEPQWEALLELAGGR